MIIGQSWEPVNRPTPICPPIFFLIDFIFQYRFRFTTKLSRKKREHRHIFSFPSLAPKASSVVNIPSQSGTCCSQWSHPDTLLSHKSTVYLTVWCWSFRFYGFWQMYDDMFPPLQYHTEQFLCPTISLLCLFISLSPQLLTNTYCFTSS